MLKKEKDANILMEHNQELIEKYILKNEKSIKKLAIELNEMKEGISTWKLNAANDIKDIKNKVTDLYKRWDIVADDRITSIPQNNKEWWEAKQIVAQAPVKVWKPKNLSQSKSGFINENSKYQNQTDEDEHNQDFSELSDEDFEKILDEDSGDTSSSTGTENLQQQKPKRKKSLQKTM
jgi:hypothetical protein